MANIQVLSEWSGVKSECLTKCRLVSAWVCIAEFLESLHKIAKFPSLDAVLGGLRVNGRAPPVAFLGDSSPLHHHYEYGNGEWGMENANRVLNAMTVHVKQPHGKGLKKIESDDGAAGYSEFDVPNCFRTQHNMCVVTVGCRGQLDDDGVPVAQCAQKDARIPPEDRMDMIDTRLKVVDGCSLLPNCKCWNCTCQGASDFTGIWHGQRDTMAGVHASVITYWLAHKCKTHPSKNSGSQRGQLAQRPHVAPRCPSTRETVGPFLRAD
jgi:hypothetical protein